MTNSLADTVTSVRPFVPAKDFDVSKRYYLDLGFSFNDLGPDIGGFALGGQGFLLQKFYVKEFAENFMMHLLVNDVDAWWAHVRTLDLPAKYGVPEPGAPKDEAWGLKVLYLIDPTGVLWHVAQPLPQADKRPHGE